MFSLAAWLNILELLTLFFFKGKLVRCIAANSPDPYYISPLVLPRLLRRFRPMLCCPTFLSKFKPKPPSNVELWVIWLITAALFPIELYLSRFSLTLLKSVVTVLPSLLSTLFRILISSKPCFVLFSGLRLPPSRLEKRKVENLSRKEGVSSPLA